MYLWFCYEILATEKYDKVIKGEGGVKFHTAFFSLVLGDYLKIEIGEALLI